MTTKEIPNVVIETKEPATSLESVASAPEATFLQALTLALWLTCLTIGVVGLLLERRSFVPKAPEQKEPPPVQAEMIDVDIAPEPVILAADQLPPAPPDKPPPDALPPDVPPLPAVAAPSPMIAFALPVAGPVRIVSASKAMVSLPAPGSVKTTAVEHLIYGQGSAASQQAPEYPDAARDAGEQGTVEIEFTVGPDGRVNHARIVKASPWPVLNQAALQVVRDRWQNPQWATTHPYLVPIKFELR